MTTYTNSPHAGSYFVYILYTKIYDKFYIGQTYDVEKRMAEHTNGLSKYTSKYSGWELVLTEEYPTRIDAMRRERELKSKKNKVYYKKLCAMSSVG